MPAQLVGESKRSKHHQEGVTGIWGLYQNVRLHRKFSAKGVPIIIYRQIQILKLKHFSLKARLKSSKYDILGGTIEKYRYIKKIFRQLQLKITNMGIIMQENGNECGIRYSIFNSIKIKIRKPIQVDPLKNQIIATEGKSRNSNLSLELYTCSSYIWFFNLGLFF